MGNKGEFEQNSRNKVNKWQEFGGLSATDENQSTAKFDRDIEAS